MVTTNGVILYKGPSQLDGQPIVVIAVGLKQKSTNTKTGAMVQTYILRSDVPPIDAVREGKDESICGGCPHRGDGTGKGRSCYVTLMHGPRGVYGAYKNGAYPAADPLDVDLTDRMVRLGTYGDPAAVPIDVWEHLLLRTATPPEGWTGYTHQWRTAHPMFKQFCMASVDSEKEMHEAHALGYRTFRVTPGAEENIKGLEVVCPASEERGHKVQCVDCKACMGTSAKAKVSIQIAAHGSGKKHVAKEVALA